MCVSHPSGWFACLYLTPVGGLLVCISPQWVVCLYLTPVGVLVCISPQWVFLCVSHPSGYSCVYLTPVGVLVCILPQRAVCLCVSHPIGCSCVYLPHAGNVCNCMLLLLVEALLLAESRWDHELHHGFVRVAPSLQPPPLPPTHPLCVLPVSVHWHAA